ncbi:MAG: large-conductance mechanosensitive channel protein MscL [Candidatus Pacebacteria bacterium]|nr:large-conductance mechanosensitive channel protein MscL [Candidatus Paceibacterota bacterium]MCF7856852.1 large-conductance mechanosensitive channel protein MscL [Candidatus Paceibacterota bacterium]
MESFLKEFKAFAIRGNVVDLAVAVVIGGAFGKIVSSLVDTVIMPTMGVMLGGINFTGWVLKIGESTIAYGKFIQAIVDFIIIAFVVFVVIRALSRFEKKKEVEKKASPAPSEEVVLLREIRDSLRK